ncbi:MAG: Ldh family oxidoreductase [Burkholderiales bacterium]
MTFNQEMGCLYSAVPSNNKSPTRAMRLSIIEATDLAVRTLTRHGMREHIARMVADHLVDAALSGHEFSSLARLPTLVELIRNRPAAGEIRIERETHCSAVIDGGDNIAYAVSVIAIDKAIDICRRGGVAVVTANNTWFSGRLAYYVERAARQGFIGLHAIHGTARTAPFGGTERLMGTNPYAIAFPSEDDPIVIDMAMSAMTHGGANLAKAKGLPLPPGLAIDDSGCLTTDPAAALAGAFLTWGGHRGYALSLAVQLLGLLAGSEVVVKDNSKFGLFFLVIDPALLISAEEFKSRVSELRKTVTRNRPARGVEKVRVPGDSSLRHRRRAASANRPIVLDDKIYTRVCELLQ